MRDIVSASVTLRVVNAEETGTAMARETMPGSSVRNSCAGYCPIYAYIVAPLFAGGHRLLVGVFFSSSCYKFISQDMYLHAIQFLSYLLHFDLLVWSWWSMTIDYYLINAFYDDCETRHNTLVEYKATSYEARWSYHHG